MINVSGVQAVGAPGPVEPVGKAIAAAPAGPAGGVSDVMEISLVAQLVAKLHEMPATGAELVARVKAEIAAGTYETQEKMDIAVDRLLKDLSAG